MGPILVKMLSIGGAQRILLLVSFLFLLFLILLFLCLYCYSIVSLSARCGDRSCPACMLLFTSSVNLVEEAMASFVVVCCKYDGIYMYLR